MGLLFLMSYISEASNRPSDALRMDLLEVFQSKYEGLRLMCTVRVYNSSTDTMFIEWQPNVLAGVSERDAEHTNRSMILVSNGKLDADRSEFMDMQPAMPSILFTDSAYLLKDYYRRFLGSGSSFDDGWQGKPEYIAIPPKQARSLKCVLTMMVYHSAVIYYSSPAEKSKMQFQLYFGVNGYSSADRRRKLLQLTSSPSPALRSILLTD
jgi:hypothetical protein